LCADRFLKIFVFKNIPIGSSYPLIRNILHITPIYNKGIAFGLFKGANMFVLMAISLLTAFYIIYIILYKKPKSSILILGLFLILSGAVGNLIDRISYGCVLDFIDIRVWPVFNIADSSISLGTLLIFIRSVFAARVSVLERRP
jgi:signal peptidase II